MRDLARNVVLFAQMTLAMACGSDSKKDPEGGGAKQDESTAIADVKRAEIDASDRSAWVGFDLDAGRLVSASEVGSDPSWDLGFKRTSIKLGKEGAVAVLKNQDFAGLLAAPSEGYLNDAPSADPAAKETQGLAFHADEDWYSYDPSTHVISSKGFVYVVKSGEGKAYKLKIADYYNADRLPAYIQLEWQILP